MIMPRLLDIPCRPLDAADLLEVEDFAYKYLEKFEIALIMAIPVSVFDDEEHSAYLAFWKGRLRRKAEFNNNVIQLSNQLSSPAQNIEAKIADRIYLNDKKS